MARIFSAKEILLVLGILAALLAVSWGIVALFPSQETPKDSSWELTVKSLIRDHIETALDATEVDEPAVSEALQAIERRLEEGLPGPLPYPVDILVVDSSEINAFTFPGGLIVVNKGLLEHVSRPEEVAAVLAHEMGHVYYGDPSDALKRSLVLASISLLSADTGALRDVAETLAHNAFTQTAEDRADQFAFEVLAKSAISPTHFADFLSALPDSPKGRFVQKNLPYLLDHPSRERRIEKARKAQFSGPERSLDVHWTPVREALAGSS